MKRPNPNAVAGVKIDKEIMECMRSWKKAMLGRDKAVLERLYGADLIYTHSNGKEETKAEAIDAVIHGTIRFESIGIAGHSVRSYGDTALSKCKITMKISTDGIMSTVILDVLHVWIRDSGQWQLVGRQAIRLNP